MYNLLRIHNDFDIYHLGKITKAEDDKIAGIIFTWGGGFESYFEDFYEVIRGLTSD